ncbi:MAG: SDR family NAD(P)-dependent oxidoreductase [Acetobacteraceae bacterium]
MVDDGVRRLAPAQSLPRMTLLPTRLLAGAFVAAGARLVIADINDSGARRLVGALGAAAGSTHCDVLSETAVAASVAHAESKLGGLDTIACFAGQMRVGPVDTVSSEQWDEVFAVNVRGTFFAVKHGASAIRRAGGGSIITTASLAGFRGAPGMSCYASAKGAVIALSTTLALELAPDRIRVNCVCPGWIDTPFNDPAIALMGGPEMHGEIVRRAIPLGEQGRPEDVAPMYVFLASEEARYITAKAFMVDGGMAH